MPHGSLGFFGAPSLLVDGLWKAPEFYFDAESNIMINVFRVAIFLCLTIQSANAQRYAITPLEIPLTFEATFADDVLDVPGTVRIEPFVEIYEDNLGAIPWGEAYAFDARVEYTGELTLQDGQVVSVSATEIHESVNNSARPSLQFNPTLSLERDGQVIGVSRAILSGSTFSLRNFGSVISQGGLLNLRYRTPSLWTGPVSMDSTSHTANNYGSLTPLPDGDIDGNGDVDFSDFLTVSRNFGNEGGSYLTGDINRDGVTEFEDFLIVAGNFNADAIGTLRNNCWDSAAAIPSGTYVATSSGTFFNIGRFEYPNGRSKNLVGHSTAAVELNLGNDAVTLGNMVFTTDVQDEGSAEGDFAPISGELEIVLSEPRVHSLRNALDPSVRVLNCFYSHHLAEATYGRIQITFTHDDGVQSELLDITHSLDSVPSDLEFSVAVPFQTDSTGSVVANPIGGGWGTFINFPTRMPDFKLDEFREVRSLGRNIRGSDGVELTPTASNVVAVPEPGSILLCFIGSLCALLSWARRPRECIWAGY